VTTQTAARVVDDALYRRVCEFYYDEADLLAQRQLTQWFELLAEDIHYRVGFPEFYEHGTRRQVGIGNPYFDDDHTSMKVRVRLLGNQTLTTAEHPPSVYNYFVSNIRARAADKPDELDVDSRLLIYRVRASEPTPYILGARRRDRLRIIDGGFRIARREASIDQAIIQAPNLSFFV
jgi:3-phenylpropionate/cinnamic acid dioxygenase small subunit